MHCPLAFAGGSIHRVLSQAIGVCLPSLFPCSTHRIVSPQAPLRNEYACTLSFVPLFPLLFVFSFLLFLMLFPPFLLFDFVLPVWLAVSPAYFTHFPCFVALKSHTRCVCAVSVQKTLTPKYRIALNRMFRVLDQDRDFVLDDKELNDFQVWELTHSCCCPPTPPLPFSPRFN